VPHGACQVDTGKDSIPLSSQNIAVLQQFRNSWNYFLAGSITVQDRSSEKLLANPGLLPVPDSEVKKSNPMTITVHEAGTYPEDPTVAESDERLMVAFAGGRSDAFRELFGRYKQPLFGFFRRRLGQPSQAEELTQETFLAVLRTASRYEASALFRTYLYAVAFRILRAHRRKAAFRATFFGSADVEREPAPSSGIDAGLQVRQALGRLERMDREVLMLREFEQLSYAEIAEVLRLPVNTVRSRLFRARTAMRGILTTAAAGKVEENQ